MKALIIGCGHIGSVAAKDLATSMSSDEIVVADKNGTVAEKVALQIGRSNVSWIQLDTASQNKLAETLINFDAVMGFLPGNLGYGLMKACIEAGKDLLDVSYMPENPLTLNTEAMKADVTIIPDCGLAPGISNVLVGHAASELERVDAVYVMVGGLPETPVPPLGYVITWSPENLIDEYMRKAVIVQKGRRVEVEALSGLETVQFSGLGELEAFYTDGLRTLLCSFEEVPEMWEKTLRYVGHAEKVKLLRTLGFFEDRAINVDGLQVSPRKMTARLLEQKLRNPDVKDIVVLRVEVLGVKNGRKASFRYHLLDRHDEERRVTAMARTTAYPASIVAQLMLKKAIQQKGVVPPERIGMNPELFRLFLDELSARGIRIVEERC